MDGENKAIRYTLARCELGWLLVAATEQGLCNVALGDDRKALFRTMKARFPAATVSRDDERLKDWVSEIARFARTPTCGMTLPLDVYGTAFQRRVWRELQAIPRRTDEQLSDNRSRHRQTPSTSRSCERLWSESAGADHSLPPGAAQRWSFGRLPMGAPNENADYWIGKRRAEL